MLFFRMNFLLICLQLYKNWIYILCRDENVLLSYVWFLLLIWRGSCQLLFWYIFIDQFYWFDSFGYKMWRICLKRLLSVLVYTYTFLHEKFLRQNVLPKTGLVISYQRFTAVDVLKALTPSNFTDLLQPVSIVSMSFVRWRFD